MDSATLSKHPDREDAVLLAFPQRYEGENFMSAAGNSDIPHIGKVELSWYTAGDKAAVTTNGHHPADADGKVEMTDARHTAREEERPVRDMDTYDEADDFDRLG